jgi:hypothetical protein
LVSGRSVMFGTSKYRDYIRAMPKLFGRTMR